jgi:Mg2+ and Co2+ transporter CorA
MRITVVYAAQAEGVTVMRTIDGRRQRLVIGCGYRQSAAEVYWLALPHLTEQEAKELRETFGLDPETA